MNEHTKLPWKSVRNTGVRNDGGYVVFSKAKPSHYPGQDERYEKEIAEWHGNLEYIALACNSHKELLGIVEAFVAGHERGTAMPLSGLLKEAKAAIKKAQP